MGAIYSGLASKGGYVLATNDAFGPAADQCAIVRVNRLLGGLLVTSRGNFLAEVRGVLGKCLPRLRDFPEGISDALVDALVDAFREEHRSVPGFMRRPLPFLLLLVGYGQDRPRRLEHVFVRNRVTDIREKDGAREYETSFDRRPSVPAENLFYGHAELARYLSERIAPRGAATEDAELLSCLSLAGTQALDKSLFPGIRMATLTEADGFAWVGEEAIRRLSDAADRVDRRLARGVYDYFVAGKGIPVP